MTRINLRLQKSIAAFELLVLVLDDFYAVDNLHETGLQSFGLSSDNGQSNVLLGFEKARASKLKPCAAMTSSSLKHDAATSMLR
jgi:hypothetical protein